MRLLALLLLSTALWIFPVHAQLWSGIIDPYRAVDWSQAGIPGSIPSRTTICSILNPGATVTQINSALSSCPSGQTVKLNAGTYNLSGTITLTNNVTLRGAGPQKTVLIFSDVSNTCRSPLSQAVCMGRNSGYWDAPANTAMWTAGYAKGASVITVSNNTNMFVGGMLILDQQDDASPTSGLIVAEALSTESGAICRAGRCQQHYGIITNISGTSITISPPLIHPNWQSGRNPGIMWPNSPIHDAGLEDLQINTGASSSGTNISIWHAYHCWLKNVVSIELQSNTGGRAHIQIAESMGNTIRDSYFYGTRNAINLSYGIELSSSQFNLIENNIFEHIVSPIVPGTTSGDVYAYNYSTDHFYSNASWNMPGPVWNHDAGAMLNLHEGNQGTGTVSDNVHGTTPMNTYFRNQWNGRDAGKTQHTHVVEFNTYSRYHNVIGNVMGEAGYHVTYQAIAPLNNNCDKAIFALGFQNFACGSGTQDTQVAETILRWGNYDVVTGVPRWNASEVPSSDAFYPNAVPGSQALPSSFYLSSQPTTWWSTPWGTPPWPPVGPDVTGGNVTSGNGTEATLDGHAYKIPARICYENSAKVNGILEFDASQCYARRGEDIALPSAPVGLTIR